MTTLYIIIYIVGFFVNYWLTKKFRNYCYSNELSDVFRSIIMSVLWPIAIWMVAAMLIFIKIDDYMEENNIKPPKWL